MLPPATVTIADRAAISTEVLRRMNAGRTVPAYAELTAHLNEATIVPASDLPASVVRLWSHVCLEWHRTGEVQVVRLVASAEPEAGQISVLMPLGVALLGRHVGDSAVVPTLGGPCSVRIVDVGQDRSAPRRASTGRAEPKPAGMAVVALLLVLASLMG